MDIYRRSTVAAHVLTMYRVARGCLLHRSEMSEEREDDKAYEEECGHEGTKLAAVLGGALTLVLLLVFVIALPMSQAAFPGTNGKIAFGSNRDGNAEIYVMNADGSEQTNLTSHPAHDHVPAWSPDGTKIAFTSERDDNQEIYVMNADGTGQTNLTNHAAHENTPDWQPLPAGVPIAEDGFPMYDVRALARLEDACSNVEERTYEFGDDPPSSTLDPYARTVAVSWDRQIGVLFCGEEEARLSSGSARARTNLEAGTLKVEAVGNVTFISRPENSDFYAGPFGKARAELSDIVTFHTDSFDTTNGLPVKVIFRVDGVVDTTSEASSVVAYFNGRFYQLGGPGISDVLQYTQVATGFNEPETNLYSPNGTAWQLVNGAYEAVFVLAGPNPVLRLFMDLEAGASYGGSADFYHTAAVSFELPPG